MLPPSEKLDRFVVSVLLFRITYRIENRGSRGQDFLRDCHIFEQKRIGQLKL
ncbi:hypothetical protein LEP1GSC133_0686 [Leptospira borgpetersenii serovar Pomona str. 200901868]|uniref:Uncharacterized protein n=1 Tax=Leptospira borgpetersenii serovar Pomona str. 200901868 TaxID=1192866 RepID=M6W7J1_LEPBO|nr:hypothetical protein LEP1GSC133_0686 [Leptospira borgpetersenii serovar Pomona str. 200901868]